jgi:hypothetical protein
VAKKAKTPAPSSAVGSSGETALRKVVTLKYKVTLNLPSDGVSGAKKRKRAEEEEIGQEDGPLAKKAKMPAPRPEVTPSGEAALQEMMAPKMADEDVPDVQASNDAPLSQKSAEKEEVSDAAKGSRHAEAEKNIPLPEKSEEKAAGENNKADEKEREEKAVAAPKATARKNTKVKPKARFATPAPPARSPYNTRSRRRAEDANARAPPAPAPGA